MIPDDAMQVDALTIYPIKSCGGIQLDSAFAEGRGFKYDRRWMLVDSAGTFISQRTDSRLGQIRLQLTESGLLAQYPGAQTLEIPHEVQHTTALDTTIWQDQVQALGVGFPYDQWFSRILGQDVQLVYMNPEVSRPLNKANLPPSDRFEVSFADGYPYLLTNLSSLAALNGKLAKPVGMDRFRSNITVRGASAHAEDQWKMIQIGEVRFLVAKPCARCQVTTIDPQTGEASHEPLATLATYRKVGRKVMFGMNLVALDQGLIKKDDPLIVLE